MNSPYAPHQQRVLDEKAELDVKISKLADFAKAENAIFETLSDVEAGRLVYQLAVMREYSGILRQRIAAF